MPLYYRFGSLRFDPPLFDDRPPLVDVGVLRSGEGLRRLSVAREHLKAEFAKAGLRYQIGECIDRSRIQLFDDVFVPLRAESPYLSEPRWAARRYNYTIFPCIARGARPFLTAIPK